MTALAAAGGAVPHWLQVLIVQVVAFALLAWVLWKFVRPVLAKILDARAREIEKAFREAEDETGRIRKELSGVKEKLSQVGREAEQRIRAAVDEAQRARDQALADARARAQAELDKARREVQIERDKAVLELRHATTELTMQAAEHLVRASMNEAVQQELAEKYLADLEKVKKA